jgi:hypothetical protein
MRKGKKGKQKSVKQPERKCISRKRKKRLWKEKERK